MSRRSETEAAFRTIEVTFEEEDGLSGAASMALEMARTDALMELARSLAEVADELHEIRHKLEKMDNTLSRRK